MIQYKHIRRVPVGEKENIQENIQEKLQGNQENQGNLGNQENHQGGRDGTIGVPLKKNEL